MYLRKHVHSSVKIFHTITWLVLSSPCRSLSEWSSLVGDDSDRPLRMYYERESGNDVSSPKHGKVRHLYLYHSMSKDHSTAA